MKARISLIAFFIAFIVALPALAGTAAAAAPEYRAGELLVKFRSDAGQAERDDVHRRHGTKRLRKLDGAEQIAVRAGESVEEAIAELRGESAVEYAEPNYIVHARTVPSDPQFSSLWGMAKIAAPAAWDTTTGSSQVVVATIDSGIDATHPDLAPNVWVNQGELNGKSGVDDDGDGYVDDVHGYNAIVKSGDPVDDNSHGTHVAGTIGAVGNNQTGVAGVNWNVKIMACKFLDANGSGAISDAIACLNYIKTMKGRGVNIVATNNSWGGGGYSQALYDAINAQRDILFIAAAGNSAANNDTTTSYPDGYDLPNIVSVAATTSTDALASFSNYGRRSVDVGAPGQSILSTIPGGAYGTKSGTSMATPHVTGLVALLKANDPTLDWRALKNLVLSAGDVDPALVGKTVTGRRINAFSSITCIDSRLLSAIKVPKTLTPGTPVTISALSINCGAPAGPVTATLSDGTVVNLLDDGASPDQAAGDGVFTATFTPTRSGETFLFSSPAGSETVTVGQAQQSPVVTTTSLAAGTVGSPYSQALAASGGTQPYSWSVGSGTLPSGLNLTPSGSLSGTPTAAGTATVTFQVRDAAGSTGTKSLTLQVAPARVSLAVATTSLPGGTVGTSYSQSLAATGGTAPYAWSIASGALPAGLSLATAGVISGTPTTAGSSTFTVQAKDAAGATATQVLTLVAAMATAKPDLVVTAVSASSSAVRGSQAVFTVTVQNQGSAPAASSTVGLYLSANNVITPYDVRLADAAVGALAPGASATVTAKVTVPTAVAAGYWYSGAIADRASVVAESNENNNALVGNLVFLY